MDSRQYLLLASLGGSGQGDVDGAGRVVLDDYHASVFRNRLVAIGGMGQERLCAAADGDDHLAGLARGNGPGDTSYLPDHVPNHSSWHPRLAHYENAPVWFPCKADPRKDGPPGGAGCS